MSDAVERICPTCRATQHISAHYCATCGAPLERLLPARVPQWLPASVRQRLHHPIVRGVALGVTALAVELVVHIVQRAMTRGVAHSLIARPGDAPVQRSSAVASPRRTTVTGRRRTWLWRDRHGNTRTDEQIEWQRIDE